MDLYAIRQQLCLGVPLTSIKLRVTGYSRVSTDHQEQKSSLTNQKEHFEKMIKDNPNWTYITSYVDEGISGTSDIKRDNFMRMIEDAKNQKFDLIITKEISRFSRNTLDSIKYTRELLSHGVAVLFLNDNINTALPDSELRLTIMASMAQDEIRRLSERVKFGMRASINKGNVLGNNMLYGYKKDPKTGNLQIQEEQAEVIKRLFIMYAIKKKSLNEISRIFNKENLKTNHNKEWSPSTLSRMIKNIKYKGYYCGKKTEVIDYMTKKVKYLPQEEWIVYKDTKKVPPIIDETLWDKANNRLQLKSKTKRQSQNNYPYSSKIYCKKDKSPFYRRKQCKKTQDTTWLCSEYLKAGKKKCNSPNIREKELDYILKDVFTHLDIDLSKVKKILLNNYQENKHNVKRKNVILNKEEALNRKKEKLLELVTNNYISNQEFTEINNNLNNELIKLKTEQKEIKVIKDNNNLEDIINKKISMENTFDKLLSLILTKIVASKDGNIITLEIYLKHNITPETITYSFKRGDNIKSTKHYNISYKVICYSQV